MGAVKAALWVAIWLGLAVPARAEVFLENMTSPELVQAISQGKKRVIIPTGGTEQNGRAMVLGKHNIRVRLMAERIARALGDTIVAPVISHVPQGGIDPPSGHMVHAGSMTVPPALFAANVEWSARSLKLAGFRQIILIGDSGWNLVPLQEVAQKLNREWGGGVLFADAYYGSHRVFAETLGRDGHSNAGVHAGLADVALMLALDPQAVRDKGAATSEMGQRGVEIFIRRTVAQIRASE